jgi:hypothetical protein
LQLTLCLEVDRKKHLICERQVQSISGALTPLGIG